MIYLAIAVHVAIIHPLLLVTNVGMTMWLLVLAFVYGIEIGIYFCLY